MYCKNCRAEIKIEGSKFCIQCGNTLSESSQAIEINGKPSKRLLSLDFFKGLTILLMVFVNMVGQFTYTPSWSKHAVDFGLTYVDLIAPFFVFMMALNYKSSFLRRMKELPKLKAYMRIVGRYLIFLGLGFVLTINKDPAGNFYFRWGTLQVLGIVGLLLLPLIVLPAYVRLVIGIVGLSVHQFLLETSFKQIIYDGIEGGFFGSLSWGSMMIISSVLAEGLYRYMNESTENGKRSMLLYFLLGGLLLTTTGIILNCFSLINFNFVVSRQYMTASYVVICVGISSLFFYGLFYIIEIFGKTHDLFKKDNFISKLGRNSFFLFIVHILLISLVVPMIPEEINVVLVFLLGFINVFIIWLLGYFMYKGEIFIVV
jgi:predicted acyltransferase